MKKVNKNKKVKKVVAVSGGFDPIHIGHVRMFQKAKKLGDYLVVIVNNDNWLKTKKGFVFMPQKERVEIIKSFPFVDRVVLTKHKPEDPDRSVCNSLKEIKPKIFANGGDRILGNTPEATLCKDLGITVRFGIGSGGKVQSSSWLVDSAIKNVRKTTRPWGEFFDWDGEDHWHLKTVRINPKGRLSLQYHNKRAEQWILISGDATATFIDKKGKKILKKLTIGKLIDVPVQVIHRLESRNGATIVEIAHGQFDETDIVRLEDIYGRIK